MQPVTCRNLAELHFRQAERLGPRVALRFKEYGRYRDLPWAEYDHVVRACAAALVAAGIQPGDRVGLLAENRVEWLIADLGILAAAAVNVPPHAPLTARQVQYQLADANVRWLFVSTREQLDKIRQVRHELPELRGVVVFDRDAAGPDAVAWEAFLQSGRRALTEQAAELEHRRAGLTLDDLATIMYTSGTTGNPKGVMLTHGNLLSNACAAMEAMGTGADAVALTWLPFSHIYARTCDHYGSLAAGFLLCLAQSPETVVDNLEEIHPTQMSSVPRFYEKVLTAYRGADAAATGRSLRRVFGPRLRWLMSGGAPLPPSVGAAYLDAGILLLQGYGLTESSPVISFNRLGRNRLGTVGPALPGVEVRIATDGEVLTRGPHVMKGYWNNAAATAEAVRDGWLHTGDLGAVDADGFLAITGRKKELLVLSNGKKVAPTQVEALLVADPCVDQAVVCGEGRNYLTALVVPHWDKLRAALGGTAAPPEVLARDPAVTALLQARVDAALVDVAGWEHVKKLAVLARPFTVAADELTVSLKLRRGVIAEHYREEIEAMYRE